MSKSTTTRIIFILSLSCLTFIGLVYYNYSRAQKAIQQTKPAPLSIELTDFPRQLRVSQYGTFSWNLNASPDLSTSHTTIFWSYNSTPSALTKLDSPSAVRYSNSQTDYSRGYFSLPDTFSENISFPKIGRVYFRAYALVRGDHLWTEEKALDIIP